MAGNVRVHAALSRHPDVATATAEAIGAMAETLGPAPDVVLVSVTEESSGPFGEILAAVDAVLHPTVVVGAVGSGIIGGTEEVERGPGVALWGLTLPDDGDYHLIEALRVEPVAGSDALVQPGLDAIDPDATVLVIGDPATFDAAAFAAGSRATCVGGLVVGSRPVRLALGGRNRSGIRVHDDGAVGVVLPPGIAHTVTSSGGRPIGSPWTVTGSRGRLVDRLGGRPALDRLNEILADLDARDRIRAGQGLMAGIAAVETDAESASGDFLLRPVLGADKSVGAVAVAGAVPVGSTLQFFLRDGEWAHNDLARRLADRPPGAIGALLFASTARGSALFAEPSHDAHQVAELALGSGAALAGWFCDGELAPVNAAPRRNALHGFSATVLLIGPAPGWARLR